MGVLDWLLGRSKPQEQDPLPRRTDPYPTANDAMAAEDQDYSYGTGNERFLKGATIRPPVNPGGSIKTLFQALPRQKVSDNPNLGNLQTRAQLASGRSAIAALGHEPRRTAHSEGMGPTNLAGLYDPKGDMMWVNAHYPSAQVHESVHRGIQTLINEDRLSPKTLEFIEDPKNDELTTRYVMMRTMGNPEVEGAGPLGKEQIEAARLLFEGGLDAEKNMDILRDLERVAQKVIAERKPFGMHR